MAFLPKRGLNILQCETARALKLTGDAVEPLSFTVPRKSDAFQPDIYPPTFSGFPSLSADEWMDGNDKPPVLISLEPGAEATPLTSEAVANGGAAAAAPAIKVCG